MLFNKNNTIISEESTKTKVEERQLETSENGLLPYQNRRNERSNWFGVSVSRMSTSPAPMFSWYTSHVT